MDAAEIQRTAESALVRRCAYRGLPRSAVQPSHYMHLFSGLKHTSGTSIDRRMTPRKDCRRWLPRPVSAMRRNS